MLYLDTSALVKRYSSEKGSVAVIARFNQDEEIFTSRFTFSEVHASLGRKFRAGQISAWDLYRIREEFEMDWLFSLTVLDLDVATMSAIPHLVEQYSLTAGDAVQLSAAVWLRDRIRLGRVGGKPADRVEFGAADRQLAKVARMCGLKVFDPEAQE